MGVVNPEYEEYVGGGGRLEIDDMTEQSPYSDLEISYLTKDREGLYEFREQYDMERVDGETLEEVVNTIFDQFRDGYDDQ
jgi:hypothetical protein